MSEAHLTPHPHPVAHAATAPYATARAFTEHIDAHLTARMVPGADISYVIDSVTVPVPGPPGPPGPAGEDGTRWFDGEGPPIEPIIDASPGDYYLNTVNGDVYVLTQTGPPPMVMRIVPGPNNPAKRLVPGG